MICTHHWLIPTPKGEYSLGVCKFCGGEKKLFQNTEVFSYNEANVLAKAVTNA